MGLWTCPIASIHNIDQPVKDVTKDYELTDWKVSNSLGSPLNLK
jgi:hypothetical protein